MKNTGIQYPDGIYKFERKNGLQIKRVTRDHVKLNNGTLEHIEEFAKRNEYTKVTIMYTWDE